MELDLRLLVTVDERVLQLGERLVVALERLAAASALGTLSVSNEPPDAAAFRASAEARGGREVGKAEPTRRRVAPLAPVELPVPAAEAAAFFGEAVPELPPKGGPESAPARATPAEKRRAAWSPEKRAAQAEQARAWHRAQRQAIPLGLQTKDGGISTAALEEARVGDLEVVPMSWDDAQEWARRWAPAALEGDGRIFAVSKRISDAREAMGLPRIRLIAHRGPPSALVSAGLG